MSDPFAALPRVRLGLHPTPLHELPRLRAQIGGENAPRLFIKRDDMNGIAMGGNKLRKLEFLLADAQQQGCDTLITAGAAQSNHCRLTAAVAAMYGMESHLCLRGPEPHKATGNLILDQWLGANLHFAEPGADVSETMAPLAQSLRSACRKPYIIPIGGSNAVGATGYALAARELLEELPETTYIFAATGSGGTQAGLEAGLRLLNASVKMIGIGVADPDSATWGEDVARIANAVGTGLGADLGIAPEEIETPMDWMGPRYGARTAACDAAIHLLARTDGIFVDPVYSGKALAGLIDMVKAGRFRPSDTIVFWHTGGVPALFA